MTNIFKKLKNWNPFNSGSSKKKVYYAKLEEDLLTEKGINKSLQNENNFLKTKNASLEGQIAEKIAKEKEKKDILKEKEFDNKIAIELNEQQSELDKKRFGRWLSLKKLFNKLEKDKKFRNKFEISDKNDEVSWKFGDIRFATKGYIGIFDSSSKLRVLSPSIQGLIFNPSSILNQVKRGRLLLARDKEGNYIDELDEGEGIDDMEMKVPIFNEETGEYDTETLFAKKVRKLFIDMDTKLRNYVEKLKRADFVITGLKDELEDVKRTNNNLSYIGKNAKTTLSESYDLIRETMANNSDQNKKIASMSEKLVLYERELNIYKGIVNELHIELEKYGGTTAYKKVMAMYKDAIEFTKSNTTPIEKEVIVEKTKNIPTKLPTPSN